MKRIIRFGFVGISLVATLPLSAQTVCPLPAGKTTTTAELATCAAAQSRAIDSLRAKLLPLDSIVKDNYQLKVAFADVSNQLVAIHDSIKVLRGSIRQAPGAGIGNVVNGDLIVNGRVCVFYGQGATADGTNCKGPSTVQLYGLGSDLMFCSNIDQSYAGGVSPNKRHCGRIGVAPEGGIRIGYNEPLNMAYNDPTQAWSFTGFDSQATWCLSGNAPNSAHEQTQDLCYVIDEPSKTLWISSWRPGWRFGFITSSGLITLDKRWGVPQQ